MQIGKTIRKYRKEKGITQEEMANRLGVTTPAVNKWEKGTSCPDITLLAPIARLLGISLDTLLSFQEELTNEEITNIVLEVDERLKTSTYDEIFIWAKSIIETYPNCLMLIWQLATILDAQRLFKQIPNTVKIETHKEDIRLVEQSKAWVLSPERKASKKECEYAAKRLDVVITKITNAMKSTIQKIHTTLIRPEVKKEGVEQIKKKARTSILEKLNRNKAEIAERDAMKNKMPLRKQEMDL